MCFTLRFASGQVQANTHGLRLNTRCRASSRPRHVRAGGDEVCLSCLCCARPRVLGSAPSHSACRHVRRHHDKRALLRAARPCEARVRRVRSVSCGAAAAAQALPEATFTKRTSRCTAQAARCSRAATHATVRVFGLARAWGRFTVAAPQRESNCETNPQWRSESGSSGFCKTLKSGERCNCQP